MRFEKCLVIANCTVQLMTDPVTTSDGHTFERSAIERWLTGVTSILPLILYIFHFNSQVPLHLCETSRASKRIPNVRR